MTKNSNLLFVFFLVFTVAGFTGDRLSYAEKITRGGMRLIKIKGGCFMMGDTFGDGLSLEKPVHEVCLDDFYLGEHEVTQGEWKGIMQKNPSLFKRCGDDCPVEYVNWFDVMVFIEMLNDKTGLRFRLPTEAEWEYAAREGGKKIKWSGTNSEDELGKYAWYAKNSDKRIHPVKTKKPNALGLYDMSGNVWEWVSDLYATNYYANSPRNNPKGADADFAWRGSQGLGHLGRGGSWFLGAREVRTSHRRADRPTIKTHTLGFRLAMDTGH